MTPDWQQHATCKGVPWLMDPPEDLQTAENEALALALCGRCPVLDDCRDWVLSLDVDPGGIAGGMTAAEREQIRATTGDPKPCTKCGQVKQPDQFRPVRPGALKREPVCRACRDKESVARKRRRRNARVGAA